jgi:hypothetical protein
MFDYVITFFAFFRKDVTSIKMFNLVSHTLNYNAKNTFNGHVGLTK